jgi:hypothetical protein
MTKVSLSNDSLLYNRNVYSSIIIYEYFESLLLLKIHKKHYIVVIISVSAWECWSGDSSIANYAKRHVIEMMLITTKFKIP